MRKNLKEARLKAGMTQQQVADKLEVGLRHYQKIERCVKYSIENLLNDFKEKAFEDLKKDG